MSIVVFWLRQETSGAFSGETVSQHRTFASDQLVGALSFMSKKRQESHISHVGMVSEPEGQVGAKDAGGAVENGKLPDGTDYTWKMRRV